MDLLGGARRNDDLLVVRDQRVLRAIADLGSFRHVGYFAPLVGGLLEVLEVIQADAIEGARHHRHFDLDVFQSMRALGALPFARDRR